MERVRFIITDRSPILVLLLLTLVLQGCGRERKPVPALQDISGLLSLRPVDLGAGHCGGAATESVLRYYQRAPFPGDSGYGQYQAFLKELFVDSLSIVLTLKNHGVAARLGVARYDELVADAHNGHPSILFVSSPQTDLLSFLGGYTPYHVWVFVGVSNTGQPCILTPETGPVCIDKEKLLEKWEATGRVTIRVAG